MRPPLEGVRILAISQFGAGPFGTNVLADLGAEIIKIEDPSVGGDVARYIPPFEIEGDSLYHQSFNRGKKSVALNLRSEGGMATLQELVKVSDGVFNNLRGDLPARLGIDYDALGKIKSEIVCCSLSGFGKTGPMAATPGYDYLIQGYAGYMSITGEPDGPPGKCGVSIIDFAGGYAAALGLMVGLFDAQRGGVGRDVDVSLLDTAVAMLSYFATWTLNRDWVPTRTENSSHQTLVPAQNFQTSDGWIVIFCAKEKFYRDLVAIMGMPELATDPRFDSFGARLENRSELLAMLSDGFRERTTIDWLAVLNGKVPCGPVNDVAGALELDQVRAREMIIEVEHPEYGTIREVANPVKMAGEIRRPSPAPKLGEHTDQVLRELLGYGDAKVEELRASGAIG
jgi:crotonobetainyl-CoA:carnitine CoA-transferase CaiB-like acyl-CoA transferase